MDELENELEVLEVMETEDEEEVEECTADYGLGRKILTAGILAGAGYLIGNYIGKPIGRKIKAWRNRSKEENLKDEESIDLNEKFDSAVEVTVEETEA